MPEVGLCAQVACVWEVTARKPGNVHRFRDFDDATYIDFVLSAAAIAPELAKACRRPVGETVLACVGATRRVVATNTNLGIVLLLAPLAAVPDGEPLRRGITRILHGLTVDDARLVYEAIRLARPGGLGRVAKEDVTDEPTISLRQVMALAANRDLVARQYANGFEEVFAVGVPAVEAGLRDTGALEPAIIRAHLELLARFPDTLIARKCEPAVATEAAARARGVLDAGWPTLPAGRAAFAGLDAWLRADGRRRNPGATADLLTACLFILLREDTIPLPPPCPWSAGFSHD